MSRLPCLHIVIFFFSKLYSFYISWISSFMLLITFTSILLKRTTIIGNWRILTERILDERISMWAFEFWISYCICRNRVFLLLLINISLNVLLNSLTISWMTITSIFLTPSIHTNFLCLWVLTRTNSIIICGFSFITTKFLQFIQCSLFLFAYLLTLLLFFRLWLLLLALKSLGLLK